ncbi:NAD(P)H-binding protein [Dactylosporangium sp. McL0621]|uniref:NmrA family NAD(P)-binding protein n=1 Tax=Dactylosporangium sp. McL0621 TaxID=3415678 RepID=UPI003CECACF1
MENVLVFGGTGKTGRRVADVLRSQGRAVRTAARTGADVRVDLGEPGTWGPALDGVAAAYLVEPDLRSVRLPGFVAAATQAGVERFVLLSAPGAVHDRHPLFAVEAAVRASGAAWTILRPGWFAQNFTETDWHGHLTTGELALPTGDGRTAFVDAEDIAEVAAAALTSDRHDGERYALTGPRALSFGEAVDLVAAATGLRARHVDVTPGEYVERQVAGGVPRPVAEILAGVFTAIRDGRDQGVSDGVERALGRPPRPFEEYVSRLRTG